MQQNVSLRRFESDRRAWSCLESGTFSMHESPRGMQWVFVHCCQAGQTRYQIADRYSRLLVYTVRHLARQLAAVPCGPCAVVW
eukprot:COSAG06_NODE_32546_length_504_cov_0.767901_1_plen_82_part_10